MRTGLTKQEKTTDIWFDEKDPLIHIRTHNTDLKKRHWQSRNGAEQKKPNTTAAIWRKNADNGENSGNGSRNKSPMNFPLSQTRKEKKAHEKID